MKNMADNFDLISLMVNETFNSVEESSIENFTFADSKNDAKKNQINYEASPVQLEFYFESFLGGYDASRNCYIFQIEDQVIECPVNWGPFRFSTFNAGEVEELFSLEKFEDVDYFFEIIESIIYKPLKSLKCLNMGTHLKLVYDVEDVEEKSNVLNFPQTNLALVA